VPKVPPIGSVLFAGKNAYRTCAIDKQLIARPKKSGGRKILTVQNLRGAGIFMANLRQYHRCRSPVIPSVLPR